MDRHIIFTPEKMEQLIAKLRAAGIIGSYATTIEAWWDIPQALGMEVITTEDINQAVSSIWHEIFDLGIIPGRVVPAETIAVIPLKTNDEPLEVLWDIPQELTITNIPSKDINQAVATLWQETFE